MERIRKLPIKGLQCVGKYGKIKSVKRLLLQGAGSDRAVTGIRSMKNISGG